MQTHRYAFYGFQVRGVEDITRYLERVYVRAGTESETVITERIAFIVIDNTVGKINGIGGVFPERVKQLHLDLLAYDLDLGLLYLWR